jgi:hypothetical protein
LSGTAAAVYFIPKDATSTLQHMERAAVVLEIATVGWSSVAAFVVGGIYSLLSLSDWNDIRKERKTMNQSI